MDSIARVFPAAKALGLLDEQDEYVEMWEAFLPDGDAEDASPTATQGPAPKGRRGGWRRSFQRNPDAELKYERNRFDHTKSSLWENFVVNAADARVPGSRIAVEFQQAFNVPFAVYDELLRLSQEPDSPFKDQYALGEKRGPPRTPLALKIMVVLFALKENISFTGSQTVGCIGASTARAFFHKWLEWILDKAYAKHVHPPESPQEITTTMKKFERLGVPGCITLIDGVHINWDMCPYALLPLHKGKEGASLRGPSMLLAIAIAAYTTCMAPSRVPATTRLWQDTTPSCKTSATTVGMGRRPSNCTMQVANCGNSKGLGPSQMGATTGG